MVRAFPELWVTSSGDPPEEETATIFLVDHEQNSEALSQVQKQAQDGKEAVTLCFGPSGDEGWREELLHAGALACFSSATTLADQIGLLRLAVRHRLVLTDLDHIRQESNRICQSLLESFGGANESLVRVRGEAEQMREDLERVRERILRAFI